MCITATVLNDTIMLPPGVHLPDGTQVRIETTDPTAASPGGKLAERYAGFVGLADDLPEDLAKNHDHYLHGAPKRP